MWPYEDEGSNGNPLERKRDFWVCLCPYIYTLLLIFNAMGAICNRWLLLAKFFFLTILSSLRMTDLLKYLTFASYTGVCFMICKHYYVINGVNMTRGELYGYHNILEQDAIRKFKVICCLWIDWQYLRGILWPSSKCLRHLSSPYTCRLSLLMLLSTLPASIDLSVRNMPTETVDSPNFAPTWVFLFLTGTLECSMRSSTLFAAVSLFILLIAECAFSVVDVVRSRSILGKAFYGINLTHNRRGSERRALFPWNRRCKWWRGRKNVPCHRGNWPPDFAHDQSRSVLVFCNLIMATSWILFAALAYVTIC